MAKGKKKSSNKSGRTVKGGSQCSSSDDESVETCSVFSGESHFKNASSDNEEELSGADEVDSFEEKLKEAMEGTSAKSAAKRAQCLEALCKGLSSRYCPEFLSSRPVTMIDICEKGLKKGKSDEQVHAASLAAILSLQFGSEDEAVQLYTGLEKIFTIILHNTALAPAVRERSALALAVCSFVAHSDDPVNTQALMSSLEQVFCGSYLKGDGTPPSVSPALSQLHQTCLLSWALLLTVCPSDYATTIINRCLPNIAGMLQSSDLDLRLTSGEVIATMFELARGRDADYAFKGEDVLCDTLSQLATDAHKFRAKKDRKLQRATFRDVLRAVQEGEAPDIVINFSRNEPALRIDSWYVKRYYDVITCLLASGMNHHLENNLLLRDIFKLGAPVPASDAKTIRTSKYQRHLVNVAVDRQRTQRMNKLRDKRADVF